MQLLTVVGEEPHILSSALVETSSRLLHLKVDGILTPFPSDARMETGVSGMEGLVVATIIPTLTGPDFVVCLAELGSGSTKSAFMTLTTDLQPVPAATGVVPLQTVPARVLQGTTVCV
jgi:hypothetical protein